MFYKRHDTPTVNAVAISRSVRRLSWSNEGDVVLDVNAVAISRSVRRCGRRKHLLPPVG